MQKFSFVSQVKHKYKSNLELRKKYLA